MAIDSSSTKEKSAAVAKRISEKANQLHSALEAKKGDEKKVDYLYSSTHDEFLKKYKEVIDFKEIFASGTYNCVTGTALLAMVFNQLNVPIAVKEKPGHVYLIAYPQTSVIKVEVTDPVGKYIIYDKATKANFVTYLEKAKLVTKDEVTTLGADSIFNQFYFHDTTINMVELAGDQYVNDGVVQYENKQYDKAYQQWQKAYYLHPSYKNMLLLVTSAALVFNGEYHDSVKVKMLAALTRFQMEALTDDVFLTEFRKLTQKYLIEQNDAPTYDKLYAYLMNNIQRDSLKQDIQFGYNYERGRVEAMQHHVEGALPFVEKAYSLRPNNLNAQMLLTETLMEKLRTSPRSFLHDSIMDAYATKYPALKKNNSFSNYFATMLLLKMGFNFDQSKVAQGEQYRKKFELLMDECVGLEVDREIITNAYLDASKYYFKKAQYETSKACLRKGLKYVPDSYELKKRLTLY